MVTMASIFYLVFLKLYLMCMSVHSHLCVCTICVPTEARKDIRYPVTGSTRSYESLWVLGTKPVSSPRVDSAANCGGPPQPQVCLSSSSLSKHLCQRNFNVTF